MRLAAAAACWLVLGIALWWVAAAFLVGLEVLWNLASTVTLPAY